MIYIAYDGNYRFQNEIRDKKLPRIYGWALRGEGSGIAWNGYHFYLLDKDEEPIRNIVYIDQILNNWNIQDIGTVIGLLEVGFQGIIKQLPFIKEIILVSDNSTSYQKHYITIMKGLFDQNFYGELFILSILHSETQYCKTLLDAHFATTNQHLLNFMKNFKDNRVVLCKKNLFQNFYIPQCYCMVSSLT